MNISDKIEIIRDLIAQRDDIDSQIEELLGLSDAKLNTGPDRKRVRVKVTGRSASPAVVKVNGRKRSSCGKCGETGHNAKTCPNRNVTGPDAPSKVSKQKLTEQQFDGLKEQQKAGTFASRDFASYRNLPLSEVNRAVVSESYEAYCNF